MTGTTIGNYTITSFLEEGGMGSVYIGFNTKLERKVAIKVLHKTFTSNPQFRERFVNEARILAKLNHPNIVSIYDLIEDEGLYCIVMEYVDGLSLSKFMSKHGALDNEKSKNIILQALEGLSYAHNKFVVHRDIKPSNIILDENGTVKILDFGIAKMLDSDATHTRTGTKMGSLCYMSPEQVLGKELDLKTDIYSLGVTLFEMLTGILPFDADTESDYLVQTKIINESLPDPRSLNPDSDEILSEAVNIATRKNREERFNDCLDFKKFLESGRAAEVSHNYKTISHKSDITKTVLVDSPLVSKTILETDVKKPAKNRSKLIVGLASLILLLTVTFYFLFFSNPDSENSSVVSNLSDKSVSEQSTTVNRTTTEKQINGTDVSKSKIVSFLDRWLDATINKDRNIGRFYGDKVDYYNWGQSPVSKVLGDKFSNFKKWDKVDLRYENLEIESVADNVYTVTFDKYFETENFAKNQTYSGKVKSRVKLMSHLDDFKVICEKDDRVYYTNKN